MTLSDSLRHVLLELFEDEMNQELLSEPIESETPETPDTDRTPSRAVMTTWETTLQQIQRISPSIRLLQLMSFLDPDEILAICCKVLRIPILEITWSSAIRCGI